MNVKEYLDKVAYVGDSDIEDDDGKVYFSNFDSSYITRVSMEDNVKFLADREITDELTHGVGFSPKDGKWYGWSHRAIYGFEIGSTCKKGDCHYNGSTEAEQEAAAIAFWDDDGHDNPRSEGVIEKDGERYFVIKWDYSNTVPNETLRNTVGGVHHRIKDLGRGERTAKTMEDAKQMAKDFCEGVS